VHSLQLSYEKSSCNHAFEIGINSCNYFERGKHVSNCHDNFKDPLHVLKSTNLHQSNGYIVKFASTTCNYYERGGNKGPLYVSNNHKLKVPTDNMHWFTPICCDSFIYKMPMHRKKVRLCCHLIHALWCVSLCCQVLDAFIGLITPWDPGILEISLPTGIQ
jgi:hypothetical protein